MLFRWKVLENIITIGYIMFYNINPLLPKVILFFLMILFFIINIEFIFFNLYNQNPRAIYDYLKLYCILIGRSLKKLGGPPKLICVVTYKKSRRNIYLFMDDFYTEKLSSAKPRVAHTGGKKPLSPAEGRLRRDFTTQKNFLQRSRE